jgi:hypothetical protein
MSSIARSLLDNLNVYCIHKVDQDSVDDIGTRYGLYGRGIESQWRRDFQHPTRPAQGPSSLLCNAYRVFPQSKMARAFHVDCQPLCNFEVKERVKLYLYSQYGPSWHVLGWTLPSPYCIHTCYDCVFLLYVYVWLPWLGFFRAFSSVVRQMPG